MRPSDSKRVRGFTLIELMLVVAIIGLISSIAIPGFTGFDRKAKRAERETLLAALELELKDMFNRYDAFEFKPDDVEWNPQMEVVGMKPWNRNKRGWTESGFAPDGNLRFRYHFFAVKNGSNSEFTVEVMGDLDKDGKESLVRRRWRLGGSQWALVDDFDNKLW